MSCRRSMRIASAKVVPDAALVSLTVMVPLVTSTVSESNFQFAPASTTSAGEALVCDTLMTGPSLIVYDGLPVAPATHVAETRYRPLARLGNSHCAMPPGPA